MSFRLPNDLQFFLQAYHQRPVHHTLYSISIANYVIRRNNYKDERLYGLSEGWNDQGQRIWCVNYKNEQRHGLSKGWNDQGQLKWRNNYKDGEVHGLAMHTSPEEARLV